MATPSHFQTINKNQFFQIKIEFRHRVGNALSKSKMRGPQTNNICGQKQTIHNKNYLHLETNFIAKKFPFTMNVVLW